MRTSVRDLSRHRTWTFERSIRAGAVMQAEAAARELGRLSLSDALRLVELYTAYEPEKFERAAIRWFERYLVERQPTLLRAQVALAALGDLRSGGDAATELLADFNSTPPAQRTASSSRGTDA
jgi:hypothetical protein